MFGLDMRRWLVALAFALSAVLVGCDDGGEDAAEEAGDAVEEAGEAATDAVEETGEAVEDATDQ